VPLALTADGSGSVAVYARCGEPEQAASSTAASLLPVRKW